MLRILIRFKVGVVSVYLDHETLYNETSAVSSAHKTFGISYCSY